MNKLCNVRSRMLLYTRYSTQAGQELWICWYDMTWYYTISSHSSTVSSHHATCTHSTRTQCNRFYLFRKSVSMEIFRVRIIGVVTLTMCRNANSSSIKNFRSVFSETNSDSCNFNCECLCHHLRQPISMKVNNETSEHHHRDAHTGILSSFIIA